MLMLPQVRRGGGGVFQLARPIRAVGVYMHISIWIFCVCVCLWVPPHVRPYGGTWWCLWKQTTFLQYLTFQRHTPSCLTASGIMLPLGQSDEAPQSPTVLLTQAMRPQLAPSFSLANILFSFCGLFAFLKKERHATFCRSKRESSVGAPGQDPDGLRWSLPLAAPLATQSRSKAPELPPGVQEEIASPATVSLIW